MLGFPVVLAIAIPSVTYLLWNDLPLMMIAQRTVYALDSFPLVAVPVFLFVGSLMNASGISTHIYRFADTAVSRLPGGLAQADRPMPLAALGHGRQDHGGGRGTGAG